MKICKIKKIIIIGLVIRLIMLFIIFVMTPDWASGFFGNTTLQDDVRYEQGAIRFAETADSIFDYGSFAYAYAYYDDFVGMERNIFSATPLWYWVVCFIYYFFHTIIAIRLFNIFLSVISIGLLYKLVRISYNEKTALTAARCLAYLPYPVVFSCFSYKDNLVMALTIYLLLLTMSYRVNGELGAKKIILLFLTSISLLLIRGGFSAILIVVCIFLGFTIPPKRNRQLVTKLILSGFAILLATFVLYRQLGAIELRFQAYVTNRDISHLGNISLVTITRIRDLYKLPLTYLFAVVMPIGYAGTISSWSDIVGICNICMAPIAIWSAVDFFLHKKEQYAFVLCCLALYFVAIIASIGVPRHYFSLLFIPIMLYSHARHYGSNVFKFISHAGSLLYIVLLSAYIFFL